MRQISQSAVSRWLAHHGLGRWLPASIDMLCPACGRLANFTLEDPQYDDRRNAIAATGRCPACSKKAHVWAIEPGHASDSSQRGCKELCVHPDPTGSREPIVFQQSCVEPALERAYHSAVKAYNAGLWDACATSCRKTLEGIVHSLNPEGKGPLHAQLREVFSSPKLTEPLVHVADSLRKGGNLGAHFDLEREADREVAQIMLDLIDYFLEYAFVLKGQAAELERRLDSLGTGGDSSQK